MTLSFLVEKLIVPVLAACLGAIGTAFAKSFFDKKKEEDTSPEAIITRYIAKLKRLIEEAVSGGQNNILKNADLVLRARNDLRESLKSLHEALNGEFDRLNAEVQELKRLHDDRNQALQTIDAAQRLKGTWSNAEDRIKQSLKILAAEIGFERKWW